MTTFGSRERIFKSLIAGFIVGLVLTQNLLHALFLSALVSVVGPGAYAFQRWSFLAHRGVDRRECSLLYFGYIGGSELIMAPDCWYYRSWGWWWRTIPLTFVRARYHGLLRGLSIFYQDHGKVRSIVLKPLGTTKARFVVKRLVHMCPEALASGIEYEETAA